MLWNRIRSECLPGLCLLCHGCCELSGDKGDDNGDREADGLLCQGCLNSLLVNSACCYCCAEPLLQEGEDASQKLMCGRCQKRQPTYERIISPYLYQEPLSLVIQRFKSQDSLLYSRLVSSLLSDHLKAEIISERLLLPDLILPVPTHWRSRFKRGFNPAAQLADFIGRSLDLPVQMSWLKKVRYTPPQHELNRRQRLSNLTASFELSHRAKLEGCSVAVVDDVVTTGATADVIAELLRDNGARSVQVWALARTPSRR